MMYGFYSDYRRLIGIDQKFSLRQFFQIFLHNHGLQALLAYRLGKWLLSIRLNQIAFWPAVPGGWVVYFFWSRYVRAAYDISLDLSADIGPGLYIGHFGDIKIKSCRLGRYCNISQSTHVTDDDSGGSPEIGNCVWIGAHAKIIGPLKIGNRATISAGANVRRDIKEYAMCLGNPARVVMSEYDNSTILGLPADIT